MCWIITRVVHVLGYYSSCVCQVVANSMFCVCLTKSVVLGNGDVEMDRVYQMRTDVTDSMTVQITLMKRIVLLLVRDLRFVYHHNIVLIV